MQPFKKLIEDVLSMDLFKLSFVDYFIEVCGHVLENKIDISSRYRRKHLIEFNDVFMGELFKDGDLSICSLCICVMLEGLKYFFESIYFIRFVNRRNLPDMAIGSRT